MTPVRAWAIARVGERRIADRRRSERDSHDNVARELLRVAQLEAHIQTLDSIIASQRQIIAAMQTILGQTDDPPATYTDQLEKEIRA